MIISVRAKISKENVLVIPKNIAKEVGLSEDSLVNVIVEGDRIIIEPFKDAVWLSL